MMFVIGPMTLSGSTHLLTAIVFALVSVTDTRATNIAESSEIVTEASITPIEALMTTAFSKMRLGMVSVYWMHRVFGLKPRMIL